ncbi:hypothetical protein CH330_07225 [candidate division WOR-3 bacterium JGI_Cruoil_03_51_56]|uniref:Uncharacterized protein n=1 Tax=candidate division WOR-3 bacterium JGI_Cruoil_03_51_56 TaxID=1973747 RepID=A0A235BRS1_UNCW3|nr:MAG: hypothetical protein CH330_07225 [candidate division WOR-3 bacterium JGI_Cruoil_03_51_56]
MSNKNPVRPLDKLLLEQTHNQAQHKFWIPNFDNGDASRFFYCAYLVAKRISFVKKTGKE